jgi:acyl-CoA synthetase (AMP-forming)/AMP-acid ligase II
VIAVDRKALSDRSLICNLPINHVGAIGDIWGRTMTGGGTIHLQEKFSPLDMMQMIERERLYTIGGLSTMLQMCVNHPDFDSIDLTSVDPIAWGGAAMPADLVQMIMDKTDCTRATMGYGMTDTTGGVTYSGLNDSIELLVATVGAPDPRQPLRIWHADGREADVGEVGEIQVKGDFTMAGYWRLPDAKAEAFTNDGWLHTDDLALRRDDGYIQIVGRMSEAFKSGSYNVYPREIELALEEGPAVSMAAVVSIPDPTFQEIGIAYVMGTDTSEPDPTALRSFVRERLANYKVPKEIVVLDELPMLPIGKVDKKALKSLSTP